MNTRLKQLAIAGGMDLGKVQHLVDLHDGDEAWVEQIILGAGRAQKSADAMGVAFKAIDDGGELDEIDQAYIALRNAIDGGDTAEIDAAKKMFVDAVEGIAPSTTPHAPALEDSGAKSKPIAAKAAKPITLEALVKGYSWDGR